MYVLGIDIGGTKCAVTLGNSDFSNNIDKLITAKKAFPTDVKRGWEAITTQLLDTAEQIIEENGLCKSDIGGIGISCGGPLDSKKGIICCPPNLPDWDNVPIKAMFEERFGVSTRLQNDANACAVAEWKLGAGRGYSSLIFLTFGTGMGAGLILDGKLYCGACDLAGEVGHIRLAQNGPVGYGKAGSFEGFCSGGGIARAAEAAAEVAKKKGVHSPLFESDEPITAKSLAESAKTGDAFAKEVYHECAEKLGLGLSVLIDILNPEAIIIGSIYERSRELFDETITQVIAREALAQSVRSCRILPSGLGDRIGDLAAISLALE